MQIRARLQTGLSSRLSQPCPGDKAPSGFKEARLEDDRRREHGHERIGLGLGHSQPCEAAPDNCVPKPGANAELFVSAAEWRTNWDGERLRDRRRVYRPHEQNGGGPSLGRESASGFVQ